mgnify:CR=1 FL=1
MCEGDCNDALTSVFPGANEVDDNLDNDCDGSIDEGFNEDADGDGNKEYKVKTHHEIQDVSQFLLIIPQTNLQFLYLVWKDKDTYSLQRF